MTPTAYNYGIAVTTSDATNHANGEAQAIYVGGAGSVVVVAPNGSTATYTAPPVGAIIPARNIRVNATGTTATLLLALY